MLQYKTIGVTGASGHLGSCLIQMLLQKEYLVQALFNKSQPTFTHPNLLWVKGDVLEPESLEKLFLNSSVVIHCASVVSIGEINEEVVYPINVNGTENIIKECLERKIKLIYISSSAAVLETDENETFNENRPYKTENDFLYSWTKALSEKKILAAGKSDNLDAIILRPTAIVGPPDYRPSHFGQTIFDIANNNIPAIAKGGYNIVDVRDVSKTIINSIDKGLQGEVYLVSGNYYTLPEIAKITNPESKLIAIPINLLLFFLPLINLYKKIFSLKLPITKESLLTLKLAPKKMDNSKAKNELNHTVRPISETVKDLLFWQKNYKK